MFYDLNVPALRSSTQRDRTALVGQLFDYGYDCIGVNTTFYGRLPKEHRCKMERLPFDPSCAGPATGPRRKRYDPALLRNRRGQRSSAPAGSRVSARTGPDQVMRLTVVLQSPSDVQVLYAASDALQTYDVVAAVPCCQKSFEALCKEGDVDVISLPVSNRLPFSFLKKYTDSALGRGAVFEITYSQAIQNADSKRHLFSNVQSLIRCTRGRGIILSSGGESWVNCRGPHDVANLGQMLGLTQEQAIRAVSDTPLAVLRRAEARKSRFQGVSILDQTQSADDLAALQVPEKFYLPEAMPVRDGATKSSKPVGAAAGGVETGGRGDAHEEGGDGEEGEDDDDDEGGFLSFAPEPMDVAT